MIVKKLELQGFKSFPERTKVIFHPGITVIVGPNGTGKSNLVDAILWTLGGRRQRSLRGSRTEDIIFNGNNKKAPLGLADVSLFLGDGKEEMVISHRLFRSGEGEYRLNGKAVRLKDIQETLWKSSIAEKEYFTIEQGSIEQILTSKPVEKRQFLEEAAGTAYYKEKKRQAQIKLENSEQNLIRLEDIISEVSRAKNSLKRQANAALRYRKLREKIRQLTFLHYRRRIDELEKTRSEVTNRYTNALDREKELIARVKAEEKALADKNREIWDLEKSIRENRDNFFAHKSEITRQDSELDRRKKRVEFFGEERRKAKLNIEELKKELHILEDELKKGESRLKSLRESFQQNKQTLEKAILKNRSSREITSALEKQVESLRKEYLQKISERSESGNEKVKSEKEFELILRQEEKLKSQLKREESLLEDKEKKASQIQNSLTETRKLREERKKSLLNLEEEHDQVCASVKTLQDSISKLDQEKEKCLYHLETLKKLKENESPASLTQDIPEAVGFLADLVEINPENAPLVDIFWKEEAKSLLVPARKLLRYLEEKEIKGNFFLVSSQKKEPLPQHLLENTGVIGSLKSRLKISSKLEEHLSCLSDAVIVKDMKTALQLWLQFPGLNYITVKGDLLLSSGLLKSGQKEEGIFAVTQEIKKTEEKIAQTARNIPSLNQELEEKKDKKQELEKRLQHMSLLLDKEEKNERHLEQELSIEKAETEKIKLNITLYRHELEIMENDKKTLAKIKEDLSQIQKNREEEANNLKKELEEKERKLSLSKKRSSEEERSLYELKSRLELLQEKINHQEAQIKDFIQRRTNAEAKIRSLQEEIRASKEEESRIKERISSLSEKRKKLESEKTESETALIQKESLVQQIKKEGTEIERRIQELREKQEAEKEERVSWEVKKAEVDRDLVNLEENCWQDLKKTLKEVKEETVEEGEIGPEVEKKLESLKEELQKYKAVNLMAEEEFLEQKKRCDFLLQQKNDLRLSIDSTQEAIKKIDHESKTQFQKALIEVNRHFQEVFSLLFEGGVAELKLQDPSNPLESGIEIIAQPPGKKVQNMMLLSGGEKALTSIAFLFALFRYKPTPFCILDEVDAALDDNNLARFLNLMKKIKDQTQFIIVTHNFKTMEVADYIYGTTMAEPNVTNIYSLKLEEKKVQ